MVLLLLPFWVAPTRSTSKTSGGSRPPLRLLRRVWRRAVLCALLLAPLTSTLAVLLAPCDLELVARHRHVRAADALDDRRDVECRLHLGDVFVRPSEFFEREGIESVKVITTWSIREHVVLGTDVASA